MRMCLCTGECECIRVVNMCLYLQYKSVGRMGGRGEVILMRNIN